MATFQQPNGAHWLGTDALGRDLWSGIWEGARVSLTVGLVAALGQMLIGLAVGSYSGLRGGRIDMVIMRFVDIMIAIPFLIWMSLIVLVLRPGIMSIILAFALTQWTEVARLVRGEVLRLKETEFVDRLADHGRGLRAASGETLLPEYPAPRHRHRDFPGHLGDLRRGIPELYRPRHPAAARHHGGSSSPAASRRCGRTPTC